MGEVRDGTKALFFCFPLKFNGLFRERGGLPEKKKGRGICEMHERHTRRQEGDTQMLIPDPHACSRDSTHVTSLRVRAVPAQTEGLQSQAAQPGRARRLQHAHTRVFLLADVSASVQGHPAPGARPGLVTPAGCREDEEGERRKIRGTAPARATGAGWDSGWTWVSPSPSVMGGRDARIPSGTLFGVGEPSPHVLTCRQQGGVRWWRG